ncbi:helicase [Fragilaria crotonensis]|nr:helicase [Fragilaria crotonensis]
MRLMFHLPNQQSVVFEENETVAQVLARGPPCTQLTAWLDLNRHDQYARQFLYHDIPQHYTWKSAGVEKCWVRRSNHRQTFPTVSRLYSASPSSGERYFLRRMLTVVKGATSFEALRTVDDVLCPTFQDACRTLGLLDDDTEWHRAMQEATQTLSPARLRRLFAIILFNCDVSDPRSLYDSHWAALSEDYAHRQPSLSEQHLQDLLVRKLDALLGIMHSRSVFEWIPSLRTLLVEEHGSAMDNNSVNHLLELQLSSSNTDIQQQLDRLPLLNLEQRAIFDAVLASVNNNAGTETQKMFILLMDLQAQNTNANPEFQEVLSHFASFLLRIGEDMEPSPINLPSYIFQPQDTNELVEHVFDDFSSNEPAYWSERAILCPKNKDVQRINDMVTSRLPHDEHVFLSIDNIISEEPNDPAHTLYPPEFLNSLELSGLPPHCLTLKKRHVGHAAPETYQAHSAMAPVSLFAVSHGLSSSV